MSWSRLLQLSCVWLALTGVASAQEQLSIRCMTVEPNDVQRARIDETVRRNIAMREALALTLRRLAARSTCTST